MGTLIKTLLPVAREWAAKKITEWSEELKKEVRPPYVLSHEDAALLEVILKRGIALSGDELSSEQKARVEAFVAWLQKRPCCK